MLANLLTKLMEFSNISAFTSCFDSILCNHAADIITIPILFDSMDSSVKSEKSKSIGAFQKDTLSKIGGASENSFHK